MPQRNREFRDIDSALFKAFVFAARELNFTRAAALAGLTQSGVSQKIAKLEADIGSPLFIRINKTISLTETGRFLLDYIEKQQNDLEDFFESIGKGARSLAGPVAYAMPHSCLFTPHFPLLLEARAGFPEVSLKVDLCPNEEVIAKLLDRRIDFGFLTRRSGNPALALKPFAEEEYGLVGAFQGKKRPSASEIEDLPFVDYPGLQALFEIWREAVFPKRRTFHFESLRIGGRINSLHGAVTMLSKGVGVSVLPLHVVAEELKDGRLAQVALSKAPITSEIFLVTLKSVRQPDRVQVVIDAFQEMKSRR